MKSKADDMKVDDPWGDEEITKEIKIPKNVNVD